VHVVVADEYQRLLDDQHPVGVREVPGDGGELVQRNRALERRC
jgi:hypothetical protein